MKNFITSTAAVDPTIATNQWCSPWDQSLGLKTAWQQKTISFGLGVEKKSRSWTSPVYITATKILQSSSDQSKGMQHVTDLTLSGLKYLRTPSNICCKSLRQSVDSSYWQDSSLSRIMLRSKPTASWYFYKFTQCSQNDHIYMQRVTNIYSTVAYCLWIIRII